MMRNPLEKTNKTCQEKTLAIPIFEDVDDAQNLLLNKHNGF